MRRVLCALLVCVACASHRYVEWVPQRDAADCTIAALAMLVGTTYEVVDRTRMELGLSIGDGLHAADMQALASALGVTLVRRPMAKEGILVVEFRGGSVHAVYLVDGDVYDPLRPLPLPLAIARQAWAKILYVLAR